MLPLILTVLAIGVERVERKQLFRLAREQAVRSGKPLLVIGAPDQSYPCGDVTGDIDPRVLLQCPVGGQLIDVRDIPYPDKHFGAAFISHVLEHLFTVDDCEIAWRELWRVADYVYVAYPRTYNLIALWNPQHYLWVKQDLRSPQALQVIDRHHRERSRWYQPILV